MAMSHMRIAGIGGLFVFCQNMSGPNSLGGRLYIGVMYADLVGTDHAPHTQAGGLGRLKVSFHFFLIFFRFFLSFLFFTFFKSYFKFEVSKFCFQKFVLLYEIF
jgi:hypothetical protein